MIRVWAIFTALMLSAFPSFTQEEESEEKESKQVYGGYVLSVSGMGIVGGTVSRYDNFGTQWKGGAGYSLTGGVGIQLRSKFRWSVELDLAFEFARYRYSHINLVRDIKLNMGYQAPYAALKGTYYFRTENEHHDIPYIKLGGGYMLTNGSSKSGSEFDFNYNAKTTGSPTVFIYTEAGKIRDLGNNMTLSYGITYRYALNDVVTNTMRANDELKEAKGFSRGNHIGFVLKFFYPIKSWKSKPKTGRGDNDDIRIRI